ncbi:MAG: alkaline shock response membrane anchor protein AmaP [Selenomonadaceae bacterium]|nr:alkaline shock response membrane anchor protein AmaP [Selenomonadaceae bacterium]
MGIIRRLILLFYVLAVVAALVICAGVCLKLIPVDVWQRELNFIITREETLAALACMALASLILLTGLFARKSDKGMSLVSGDVHLEQGLPGEVKVTVPAIVGVVERAAVTVSGVRAAEASVYRQEGETPIKVRLTIVLSQGFSAPRVSENVTATINDALRTALELENVPVEVKVNEITHAIIERDKRVV